MPMPTRRRDGVRCRIATAFPPPDDGLWRACHLPGHPAGMPPHTSCDLTHTRSRAIVTPVERNAAMRRRSATAGRSMVGLTSSSHRSILSCTEVIVSPARVDATREQVTTGKGATDEGTHLSPGRFASRRCDRLVFCRPVVPHAGPSQLNRDVQQTGSGHRWRRCGLWPAVLHHPMKSLILAQDERWRRA